MKQEYLMQLQNQNMGQLQSELLMQKLNKLIQNENYQQRLNAEAQQEQQIGQDQINEE